MYCWKCKCDRQVKPDKVDLEQGLGTFECSACGEEVCTHHTFVLLMLFNIREDTKDIGKRIQGYRKAVVGAYDNQAFRLFLGKLGALKEVDECIAGAVKKM